MSQIEKLLQRFFAKEIPSDITWDDLVRVAHEFGCEGVVRTNHRAIVHKSSPVWVYPVPVHGKYIARPYISELRKKFSEIEEVQE